MGRGPVNPAPEKPAPSLSEDRDVLREDEAFLLEQSIPYVARPDGTLFVPGDISITGNSDITALPDLSRVEVGGSFTCHSCHNLVSLKGSPYKVGGDYNCYNNRSLASLDGATQDVGRDFNCSYNPLLLSLAGSPVNVPGDFNCYLCPKLSSLEGGPETVGGDYNTGSNKGLVTLKGIARTIGKDLNVSGCPIATLENGPDTVGNLYICMQCPNLKILHGLTEHFGVLVSDHGNFKYLAEIPFELRHPPGTMEQIKKDSFTVPAGGITLSGPLRLKTKRSPGPKF